MNWLEQFYRHYSQIFWEIRPFIHVLIFSNMFPESHGFVVMLSSSSIKDTCTNLSLFKKWSETILYELVAGTATKPLLKKRDTKYKNENGLSNFSENLSGGDKVAGVKFESQNLPIYFDFVRCCGPLWFFLRDTVSLKCRSQTWPKAMELAFSN